MNNTFTVHCIPWQAGTPLLQEVRIVAKEIGLINHDAVGVDGTDACSRHAIALSKSGQAIGCARLTPGGRIERIVVLQQENKTQIGVAMIEALLEDYAQQIESNINTLKGATNCHMRHHVAFPR